MLYAFSFDIRNEPSCRKKYLRLSLQILKTEIWEGIGFSPTHYFVSEYTSFWAAGSMTLMELGGKNSIIFDSLQLWTGSECLWPLSCWDPIPITMPGLLALVLLLMRIISGILVESKSFAFEWWSNLLMHNPAISPTLHFPQGFFSVILETYAELHCTVTFSN